MQLQRYNKFCNCNGDLFKTPIVYCVISIRLLCHYSILSNFRHKLIKFSLWHNKSLVEIVFLQDQH